MTCGSRNSMIDTTSGEFGCKSGWCFKCGVTWKQCECSDRDDGHLARRAEELAMRGTPPIANQTAVANLVGRYRSNLQVNRERQHVFWMEVSRWKSPVQDVLL
ncbi:unnamed protein product [Tuber aestivum]|uniref:IBR domain-containing protein n=1 Tax=Tuber aestivum TaxID=59557 RepID=A0A292PKT2_9PEZI|nr:unnamed protein product [Tuber aestivum]